MNIILSGFSQYLELTGASDSTIKNYLSDIHTFIVWLEGRDDTKEIASDYTVISSVTKKTVEDYFVYLGEHGISDSLKLRILASLRKFFTFCLDQGWISTNPAKEISVNNKTIDPLLTTKISSDDVYGSIFKQYEQILEKDGASEATMKNYSSDARQFLNWFLSPKKT